MLLDEEVERDRDEDDETIQTKGTSTAAAEVTGAQDSRIDALVGGGRPLTRDQRSFFEPRFGYDFGGVRIHDDAGAAASAGELRARAYTVGSDIVFAAGEFQPGSSGGLAPAGARADARRATARRVRRFPPAERRPA